MVDRVLPRPMEATVEGGGATAVLLLHGQPGSAGDWQRVVPLLAGTHTVVVADRPGYGRTGGPATGFTGNAAAAVDLLDRLGLARAVFVGHSWAGGAVLAAASAHPDRVSGAVLVSSVAPGEHLGWDDRLLGAPIVGELIAATSLGGVGLVLGRRRVRDLLERRLGSRGRDAVEALSGLTPGHVRVWRSFVAEQRVLLTELEGLAAALPGIRAPTVLLHGRGDRVVRPEVAQGLARALPGATLRLLPGVGHSLPHDRPEAVAAAVEEVAGPPAG